MGIVRVLCNRCPTGLGQLFLSQNKRLTFDMLCCASHKRSRRNAKEELQPQAFKPGSIGVTDGKTCKSCDGSAPPHCGGRGQAY